MAETIIKYPGHLGSLEIVGDRPYIDFHFNNRYNTDYTSRIIEQISGILTIDAALTTSKILEEDYNCDNCENGFTLIDSNKANAPFSFWSVVLTCKMNNTNDYIIQIAFPFSMSETGLKFRCKDNGTWSTWKNIAFS